MAKTRSAKAAARPPGNELLQFLAQYDLSVGELALALRSIVLDEAPTATELIYDVKYALALTYTVTERFKNAFCHIAVYRRHVNLGFNQGANLPDPESLLSGSGKLIRHIKVEKPEDLKKPYLRSFLRLAIALAMETIETKPSRKSAAKSIIKATKAGKRRPR